MKIDEAIEMLTEDINHPTAAFLPKLREAEQLGIEALKLIKRLRDKSYNYRIPLLLGETEK